MPNFGDINKAMSKQIKEEPEPETEEQRAFQLLMMLLS